MDSGNLVSFSDEYYQKIMSMSLPSLLGDNIEKAAPAPQSNDADFLTQKKKKLIRTKSHGQLMLAYLKAGTIPEGLQIGNIPRVLTNNSKFKCKFSEVSNKCSRDLLILIIDTAEEEADLQKIEIAVLEDKIKQDKTIKDINETLEKIDEEISKFKKLTLDKRIWKLKKDVEQYKEIKTYFYLVESYYEDLQKANQDTAEEEADLQKIEIAVLEDKIKQDKTIKDINETLEKIDEEISKFKKLTLDKRIWKLKKDVEQYKEIKTYFYLVESYYEDLQKANQDTAEEEADLQKIEIAVLEDKIKQDKTIKDINETLEKIDEEISKFKKLTLDKRIWKLKKDVEQYKEIKTYFYLVESYYEDLQKANQGSSSIIIIVGVSIVR
ncbi:myosin heavy chain, clone 203-like [Ambystoma mexicanum]|uniref:myosin heavy chain, clone 203-like n=1 Tax=Ambystoma mexicanum TaxID=8296 RepID=UPI0037E7E8C7